MEQQEKILATTIPYNPIAGLADGKYVFIPKEVIEGTSAAGNPKSNLVGEVKGKGIEITILAVRKNKDVEAVVTLGKEYPIMVNENRRGFKGAVLAL